MEGYIYCGFCIVSFTIGAIIGQRVNKGKDITLNPVKVVKEARQESREKREENLKIKQINTMLSNIDNYDGTGSGQTEIPKD